MDYAAARRRMVEYQLRTNSITDPLVLGEMGRLPREAFVPPALKGIAYLDEDIPLGGGRYLMEPLVLARLLQLAEIDASDVVLDIGSGTGYAATIMARSANTVVALESDRRLSEHASRVLAELPLDNVALVEGPLNEGYPSEAPYNVIFFGGAILALPERIADQLADGGRLVAVVRQSTGLGKGMLYTRFQGTLSSREAFDAATPLLPGFEPEVKFTF